MSFQESSSGLAKSSESVGEIEDYVRNSLVEALLDLYGFGAVARYWDCYIDTIPRERDSGISWRSKEPDVLPLVSTRSQYLILDQVAFDYRLNYHATRYTNFWPVLSEI